MDFKAQELCFGTSVTAASLKQSWRDCQKQFRPWTVLAPKIHVYDIKTLIGRHAMKTNDIRGNDLRLIS